MADHRPDDRPDHRPDGRPVPPEPPPRGRHGAPAAVQPPPGGAGPAVGAPVPGHVTGPVMTGRPTAPRPGAAPPAAAPARPAAVRVAPRAAPAEPAPAPAPAPQLSLDPASAYGSVRRGAAERVAGDRAAPEAEWSATALAAGAGVALAEPAVSAEAAVTAQQEAAAQPASAAPEVDERPPPPPPGRPRTPRRPWTLAGLHLVQVLVWELALLAVLAVHRERLSVLVPVAVVAAVALALTTVRWNGRWAWQWVALRVRFASRRRSRPAPRAGEEAPVAADTLLGMVSGGGWIDVLRVDGTTAALFDHTAGVTVVVEAAPVATGPFDTTPHDLPPLAQLLPPAAEGGGRLSVQLHVQTVPAPGVLGPEDPAAVSYRELLGSLGAGTVPARRRTWIALQVQRPPVDSDEEELRRTAVNAVRRVQRQVRRAGLRGHLLTPEEARAGVLGLAGATVGPDGTLAPAGDSPARESWRSWTAGDRQHVTLRLTGWPDLSGDGAAAGRRWVDRLGDVTALSTSVTVAARRVGDQELDVEGTVRVVLPAGTDAGPVVADLQRRADELGGTLRRLDGEQAAGVAATLPLGGFLR